MPAQRSTKMRPIATIGVVLLIVGGSLLASLPEKRALGVHQETFRRVPVVMVVLDEFPLATLINGNRKIDAELFPNFAKIQRDSTWFRNATTPSAFTPRALPSILSGIYPKNQTHESTKRASLFNLLGGSYEIRSHEKELGHLCSSGECEDRATSALPRLSKRYGHIFPGNRGEEFLHFLSFITKSTRPQLYFMHLVMPHQPWRSLPSGQAYPQTSPIPGEVASVGKGKEWVRDQ